MNELFEVLTLSEAAKLCQRDDSTLRRVLQGDKFIEGIDYRKTDKVWLVKKSSLAKVYELIGEQSATTKIGLQKAEDYIQLRLEILRQIFEEYFPIHFNDDTVEDMIYKERIKHKHSLIIQIRSYATYPGYPPDNILALHRCVEELCIRNKDSFIFKPRQIRYKNQINLAKAIEETVNDKCIIRKVTENSNAVKDFIERMNKKGYTCYSSYIETPDNDEDYGDLKITLKW